MRKSLDKVTELECRFGIGEEIDDEEEERNSIEADDEVTEDLIEKELLLSDSGGHCFPWLDLGTHICCRVPVGPYKPYIMAASM